MSIPQIFKSCIIEEVDFWRLFMILEQIDKDLLKMAEESDVVLKDIYKKIDEHISLKTVKPFPTDVFKKL